MYEKVDLFKYHDLTHRLAAFSVEGGVHVRGDDQDLVIHDAEPALFDGEVEHARVAGAIRLVGSRSTAESNSPTLGLVFEGGGPIIVTSMRLIVMLAKGASQLGTIGDGEVHTFVMPWDLVDCIAMPAKKSLTDRIAGGRTIELQSTMLMTVLTICPAKQVEIGGEEVRVSDDDVMRLLTGTAVDHRLSVSPADDHGRLQGVREGRLERSNGDNIAWISPADTSDLPPHLVGRVVERDENADPQ